MSRINAYNLTTKKVGLILSGTQFEVLHKVVDMHPDATPRANRVYSLRGENPIKFYPKHSPKKEILRDDWDRMYWCKLIGGYLG